MALSSALSGYRGPALATPATTLKYPNPLATTASPLGVALATPATTTGQPNPTINVSPPTASVVAPPVTAPGVKTPINVSALSDIKGPRTNALAQALIEGSNTKPRGALEALGNLGQFWAGSSEQRKYEEAETARAELPNKQIQEFVAGGGDLGDADALIATGAAPLVAMGVKIKQSQIEAGLKPPEHEKDEFGNIVERQSDGSWKKVYNAGAGVRAASPEEMAAMPGVDWSRTGIGADGKPVEFPAAPNASTEVGKILQDAERGVYGTGAGADALVATLVNRAIQDWRILTPEEIAAKIPGFVPKPGVIYQQSPDGKIDGVGAGGVSVSVGGETLTPGWKKIDETYAPEFIDWRLKGGSTEVEKQLTQLDEAFRRLESEPGITGPILTVIPRWAQYWASPKSVEVKQAVQEVVQRNLRAILGSQFTAIEGENLIARAYDENLSQEENAKRIVRLMTQIRDAALAKESAAAWFEEKGTLMGWRGTIPTSIADFNPDIPVIGEYQQSETTGKWFRFKGGLAGARESWEESAPPATEAPVPEAPL